MTLFMSTVYNAFQVTQLMNKVVNSFFSEIGLEFLSCLGYILVHKGIANKLLFVHNKCARVMEVRSMTSSPGLPLPLSQDSPTAAI